MISIVNVLNQLNHIQMDILLIGYVISVENMAWMNLTIF